MIDIVIFSKNRPMQLYALLESLYTLTDAASSSNVTVLYKYDDPFIASIKEISERFKLVSFVKQDDFKRDTVSALVSSTNEYCMFLVDDIIFKSGVALESIVKLMTTNSSVLTFSLRMGLHLNFCFPVDAQQPIPDGSVINGLFIWDWTKSQGDWSYPISLDGHIFKKSDVINWITRINFQNPNQFEDRLQYAKNDNTHRQCVCSTSSIIVNLPLNRVQDEYKNRCSDVTADQLYDMWIEGKKIDTSKILGINNTSAHCPVAITLVNR